MPPGYVQHPASPVVEHAVPDWPRLSVQVCCCVGREEAATWVTEHIAALPEPSVHAKGTVLGPLSEPASAPANGLVLAVHEDAQTVVSQSVIDDAESMHAADIPDWQPAERLFSYVPPGQAQLKYVLQASWNPWSVVAQLLATQDPQASPPAAASSLVTHALGPAPPPSGSPPEGEVELELHPATKMPDATKVVIRIIPLFRFDMRTGLRRGRRAAMPLSPPFPPFARALAAPPGQ